MQEGACVVSLDDGEILLANSGKVEIAPADGAIDKGKIVDYEAVVSALEGLLAKLGLHALPAILLLRGVPLKSEYLSSQIKIPRRGAVDEELIDKCARRLAYKVNPDFDPIHAIRAAYYVDGAEHENPIGAKGRQLKILYHVIQADAVSLADMASAMKSAGLALRDVVASPYALGLASPRGEGAPGLGSERGGAIAIDIGSTTSSAGIMNKNKIIFAAAPLAALSAAAGRISENIRTTPDDSMKLIYSMGNSDVAPRDFVAHTVVGDGRICLLSDLKTLVRESLLFMLGEVRRRLESSGATAVAESVAITHSGKEIPGLARLAEEVFALPASVVPLEEAATGAMVFHESKSPHSAMTEPAKTSDALSRLKSLASKYF